MRQSTRIGTVTLAAAFALSALAAPAAAIGPISVDGTVNALNDTKVCAPGLKAAGLGLEIPIASPQTSACAQS
ncbi:hypothetical protein ACGFJC_09105 [Nonomuraea fuscirosea]|uniref:Chaplin domain-containing protein n=1 Tax=Nonomuraea fuscirosea TaxID=1291556 RepID=A0A2T0N1V1_9ACTN|nr:hypothetical protein [Nonomuraea fuscirosea]PRX65917.1 hypothetical protein B0I32_10653 [Nonomuraea fuscirosea]WSA56519.1 hypothetical protein OIE67_18475 [Nonomuraea fuscirosea]